VKVIYNLAEFPKDIQTVLSIGMFDGVHKGHQQIIQELKRHTSSNLKSVVLTFWPHPKKILSTQQAPKLLSTLEERIELLEDEGIDYVVVLPFTKELSELTARKFVEEILIEKLHINTIVMGYDHKFGNDRKGDINFLKSLSTELKFNVVEIPAHLIEQMTISSTEIRTALAQHQILTATTLLGRYYSIEGTVVKGRALGRTIGFPTANIQIHPDKLVPANGVYAVWAEGELGMYPAMINIGNNPTIPGASHSVEVNIFDFNANLYDQILQVYFVDYLREEVKFSGIDALVAQLKLDEINARQLLTKHPKP
jgi:riboflavin kinase / FMN adenylyltransferase